MSANNFFGERATLDFINLNREFLGTVKYNPVFRNISAERVMTKPRTVHKFNQIDYSFSSKSPVINFDTTEFANISARRSEKEFSIETILYTLKQTEQEYSDGSFNINLSGVFLELEKQLDKISLDGKIVGMGGTEFLINSYSLESICDLNATSPATTADALINLVRNQVYLLEDRFSNGGNYVVLAPKGFGSGYVNVSGRESSEYIRESISRMDVGSIEVRTSLNISGKFYVIRKDSFIEGYGMPTGLRDYVEGNYRDPHQWFVGYDTTAFINKISGRNAGIIQPYSV